MIFKKKLNCFFPSFNSKIETWVICEPTTHKHTHQQAQPNTQTHNTQTHNPQIHNTEHRTQTLLWLYNRTQKNKIYIYIYIVMSAGVSHTHWTAKLKKEKKKKGELKSANRPNQILTHSLTHSST